MFDFIVSKPRAQIGFWTFLEMSFFAKRVGFKTRKNMKNGFRA